MWSCKYALLAAYKLLVSDKAGGSLSFLWETRALMMLIPCGVTEQVNQGGCSSAELCASVLLFQVGRESSSKVRLLWRHRQGWDGSGCLEMLIKNLILPV